jgi:hypothetical protein
LTNRIHQFKKLLHRKGNNRGKSQPTKGRKSLPADKGLISRIQKELKKLKEQVIQ